MYDSHVECDFCGKNIVNEMPELYLGNRPICEICLSGKKYDCGYVSFKGYSVVKAIHSNSDMSVKEVVIKQPDGSLLTLERKE